MTGAMPVSCCLTYPLAESAGVGVTTLDALQQVRLIPMRNGLTDTQNGSPATWRHLIRNSLMLRYSLRTLLILLAVGPAMLRVHVTVHSQCARNERPDVHAA